MPVDTKTALLTHHSTALPMDIAGIVANYLHGPEEKYCEKGKHKVLLSNHWASKFEELDDCFDCASCDEVAQFMGMDKYMVRRIAYPYEVECWDAPCSFYDHAAHTQVYNDEPRYFEMFHTYEDALEDFHSAADGSYFCVSLREFDVDDVESIKPWGCPNETIKYWECPKCSVFNCENGCLMRLEHDHDNAEGHARVCDDCIVFKCIQGCGRLVENPKKKWFEKEDLEPFTPRACYLCNVSYEVQYWDCNHTEQCSRFHDKDEAFKAFDEATSNDKWEYVDLVMVNGKGERDTLREWEQSSDNEVFPPPPLFYLF
jgi:hypothetical protein